MNPFNTFYGCGEIATHPELRYTKDGTPVTTFYLRLPLFDDQDIRGGTAKIRVAIYRAAAEVVREQCKRGDHARVLGSLHHAQWRTPWGEVQRSWRIVASEVSLILEEGHEMAKQRIEPFHDADTGTEFDKVGSSGE